MLSLILTLELRAFARDNALKFADKAYKELHAKYGISHQTSYVFRPQQIARVEGKQMQILEVTKALKF